MRQIKEKSSEVQRARHNNFGTDMVAAIGGLVVSTHAQESGQMAMDAAVSRVRLACCGSVEDNGCLAFIFLLIKAK